MTLYPLENKIQTYAWGSDTAIAELLGLPSPSQEPQAELWMGDHPKGPSAVFHENRRIPLPELIGRCPEGILGKAVIERFGPALPYLFKVLAAARPLSIQAHPDKAQAREGFFREERERIPMDAAHRNYRDDNHKPEIICALTPFWGLNGFRPVAQAVSLLAPVCPAVLRNDLQTLEAAGPKGLKDFFSALMTLTEKEQAKAAKEILPRARALAGTSAVYHWITQLACAYPTDIGILSPCYLHLVCLRPGQAMYLPAGQLHAYLDGVGIELMANSDNVLRGGLTPKHVDVPQLLQVVRFEETGVEMLRPSPVDDSESVYRSPAAEFCLSVLQTGKDRTYRSASHRSVEILLCTDGEGQIRIQDADESILVKKGDSLLIPACLPAYEIKGGTTIYKASVPQPTGKER